MYIENTRKATNRLLELVEDGMISANTVITMCLKWMGEDDVKEMCAANEIYFDEEDEEDA